MSEIKFKTEWLTQIALLANCGTPDDVADLCCAIQRASQGLPVNEMSSLTEILFAPIAESINADKELSEKRTRSAKARYEQNSCKTDAKSCKSDANLCKEERETEKEKDQKKEITEKEESTDASEDAYNNIESASSSLSCPELVETTSEPALITLPLNDGSEWPVTTEMVTEWSSLYPAVDVMQELRNMRGWCLAKPKNRKTPRGVRAFITTWLSKEQDRGPKPTARSGTPQRRLTASEIAALPFVDPFAEIRGTQ